MRLSLRGPNSPSTCRASCIPSLACCDPPPSAPSRMLVISLVLPSIPPLQPSEHHSMRACPLAGCMKQSLPRGCEGRSETMGNLLPLGGRRHHPTQQLAAPPPAALVQKNTAHKCSVRRRAAAAQALFAPPAHHHHHQHYHHLMGETHADGSMMSPSSQGPAEKLMKGYMVSSVNEWGADQTRILLVTDESLHRVKYNFQKEQVVSWHTTDLKSILRIEYGNFKVQTRHPHSQKISAFGPVSLFLSHSHTHHTPHHILHTRTHALTHT